MDAKLALEHLLRTVKLVETVVSVVPFSIKLLAILYVLKFVQKVNSSMLQFSMNVSNVLHNVMLVKFRQKIVLLLQDVPKDITSTMIQTAVWQVVQMVTMKILLLVFVRNVLLDVFFVKLFLTNSVQAVEPTSITPVKYTTKGLV